MRLDTYNNEDGYSRIAVTWPDDFCVEVSIPQDPNINEVLLGLRDFANEIERISNERK